VRRPPSAITGTPCLLGFLGAFHDRGELRHADAGDHAGGADRARADPDLDRIGSGVDQRLVASPVATLPAIDLDRIGQFLHPLDRARDFLVVSMRGVDHDHIAFGVDQRFGPLEPRLSPTVVAAATRRRPVSSLVALG
jgi:hypothetical protein